MKKVLGKTKDLACKGKGIAATLSEDHKKAYHNDPKVRNWKLK